MPSSYSYTTTVVEYNLPWLPQQQGVYKDIARFVKLQLYIQLFELVGY